MSDQAITAAGAVRPTGVRWKIFFLLLFLVSVNYIDRASLSVAMPLISKEFDIDPAWQGLILSSFFWTYAFMQVPGGMLADRFKPRIVIALATVFWGAFQAIAALATNWFVLLLSRLGLGASEAPIYPAGGKLNGIWMTQTERGRGATLLDGGAPLGAALGSFVITWLIAAFNSWRMAFVIAGVGTMLCGLWAWYYIRNAPREHPSVNEAEARYIEQAHALEDAGELAEGVAEVASVGGFVKQYSVVIDPRRLQALGIPLARIREALRTSNMDVGGRTVELAETEFAVRGRGYIKSLSDLEQIVVKSERGVPVLLRDVARVELTPDERRGIT